MTYPIRCTGLPTKERLQHKVVRLCVLSFLLFASVLLAACTNDANERAARLFDLQLRASDLPPGWQRASGGIGRHDQGHKGIISRSVRFQGIPGQKVLDVLISHELIDYPSVTQAGDAYAEIVDEVIPNEAWTWPEQVNLESQADQFHLACLAASSETTWCRSVAQYGNLVSIIYANVFTDKWLMWEDLKRLLGSVDARLAAARDQP